MGVKIRWKYPAGIFSSYFFLKKGSQGKRSCSLSLENLSIFSPFSPCAQTWHRDFAVCGQRPELLALDLASIFEKLLDRKTLLFGTTFHHVYSTSQAAIRLNRTLPLPVPVHLSSLLPAPATPVPCRGTAYASARGSFRSPAPTAVSGARLPFPTLPQRSYT